MLNQKRNTGIDLLRGIAILFVILLHLNTRIKFSDTFVGSTLPKMLYNFLFWSGFYGVCIFFVISGFLITTSALKKWEELPKVNIRGFYFMRFARIMPLLVLLLTVLSLLHILGATGFVIDPERASLGTTIIAALTFHINWLEIKAGYLPPSWDVLWSLSIEEMFYLFFPMLCFFLRTEKKFILAISVFMIISPFARTVWYAGNELGDRNHFAYLDAIAIGCIAAIVTKRKSIAASSLNALAVAGFGLMTFILVFRKAVFTIGLTATGLNITILAMGTAFVLIWMQKRFIADKQKASSCTGFLRFMGRNSYEIYLTHMFVVLFFVNVYDRSALDNEWIWLLYASVILTSAVLGEIVTRYFSNPLNAKLRKRLST